MNNEITIQENNEPRVGITYGVDGKQVKSVEIYMPPQAYKEMEDGWNLVTANIEEGLLKLYIGGKEIK